MYQGKPKLSHRLSAFHSPHITTSYFSVFGFFMNTNPVLVLAQANCFPSASCQAVSHVYWLEFKNKIPGPTTAWVLQVPKHVFKAFSGQACFNDRIFLHNIDEMTCYLSHFLSDLQLYTKELIRCLVYMPDYLQSELSSVSVWTVKGYITRTIPL